MWVVCVCVCVYVCCCFALVSKQEAFEMIQYKDLNPGFLKVCFWVGFILWILSSSSLQSPKLITQLFFSYEDILKWYPTDIMLWQWNFSFFLVDCLQRAFMWTRMRDMGFYNTEYSFSFLFFFLRNYLWENSSENLINEFPLEFLFTSHPILQIFVTKNELQFLILVTVVWMFVGMWLCLVKFVWFLFFFSPPVISVC